MAGRVLVGTASWADNSLVRDGHFYPKEASTPEARLRHYAANFPIVEVDSTYYFPPTMKNAAAWASRTPPDFTFHVKAYSLLTTHPTRPNSIPEDLREAIPPQNRNRRSVYASHLPQAALDEIWERFAEALMPLHSAGKLGVVHFQFPEWFLPGARSRDYILQCRDRLADYRIAVEFRNGLWLSERNRQATLAFLEEHRLPYTSVDMPQGFRSSLPPVAAVTSKELAYVRFHGRNADQWAKKTETATPRFAYLYSEEELAGWVPRIRDLASQTMQVHVLMNNCYRDYAVTNARQLAGMLRA